jgi:hypothetical protein
VDQEEKDRLPESEESIRPGFELPDRQNVSDGPLEVMPKEDENASKFLAKRDS